MKHVLIALLLAFTLLAPATAADGGGCGAPIVHRYFVTVHASPFEAEEKAAAVARKYGTVLLPSENRDGAFAMEMTEAMAESVRHDPSVVSVSDAAASNSNNEAMVVVSGDARTSVVPSNVGAGLAPAPAQTDPSDTSDPRIHAESARIKPTAGTESWTLGDYTYDGAGNILTIGTANSFTYDAFSRLKSATIQDALGTQQFTQTYSYDVFGNMLTKDTTNGTNAIMGVNSATNRMDSTASTPNGNPNLYGGYDVAGDMTSLGNWSGMTYDVAGMMTSLSGAAGTIEYIYDANDERIAIISPGSPHTWTWTLRGLDNKVLREYSSNGSTFTWTRDTVYRNGGLLLAEITPSGAKHYHLDHLGTPRMVTDASGVKLDEYDYYPFGEIAYEQAQSDSERMHFTGHERDWVSGASGFANGDAIDYMHHRFYATSSSRFLAMDPLLRPRLMSIGSWNRYSYVLSNPLIFHDPNGEDVEVVLKGDHEAIKEYFINTLMHPDGRATIQAMANDHSFTVRVSDERITPEAQVQFQAKTTGKVKVTFGTTEGIARSNGVTTQNVGATMHLDTKRIAEYQTDKSGTATVVHEFSHAGDLKAGRDPHAGDVPSSDSGPAEQEGQRVSRQKTDITRDAAEKLYEQLIQEVSPEKK